jgi:hypothetical protein
LGNFLIVVAVMAAIVAAYYAFTIVFVYILLPIVGYTQIRRLGYSPLKAAMLILGVTVLGILTTIITAVLLPQSFSGIGMFFLCAAIPLLISAFGCTLLVRRLPKRECRVSGRRRVRFPFIFLGYAIIFGAIVGFVVGCVEVLVGDPLENSPSILELLRFALLFTLFGIVLIKVGKRVRKQVSIEDAVKLDPRPPVLFLRPFMAEKVSFVQGLDSKYGNYAATTQQLLAAVRSTSDSEGNKLEEDPTISIPFEVYLGSAFRERIGPFVALGNPEDYLPPEGATRTYADDEGWYEYFERIARQAVCMVTSVSNSANLERELTFLRREGLQQRLFVFTPLWGPGDQKKIFCIRASIWILSRLYGVNDLWAPVASWIQIAENFANLGFDLGDDPGRGAVVTFDSAGKAMVLVREADTPPEFVDPVREHLTRTFGLDLGEVAADESKTRKPVESDKGPPRPKGRLKRLANSKWTAVVLLIVFTVGYISFHTWRSMKADSLYDQKRYGEAAHYFQKEAESGNTSSMTTLGYMYEEGLGVSKNEEKAAALYLRAVNDEDRPNSQAMVYLALMYLDGRGGLAKDELKALEFCRKAADANNENAMFVLGYIYEGGLADQPKDPAGALDWYKKSAAGGNVAAQKRISELQSEKTIKKSGN